MPPKNPKATAQVARPHGGLAAPLALGGMPMAGKTLEHTGRIQCFAARMFFFPFYPETPPNYLRGGIFPRPGLQRLDLFQHGLSEAMPHKKSLNIAVPTIHFLFPATATPCGAIQATYLLPFLCLLPSLYGTCCENGRGAPRRTHPDRRDTRSLATCWIFRPVFHSGKG